MMHEIRELFRYGEVTETCHLFARVDPTRLVQAWVAVLWVVMVKPQSADIDVFLKTCWFYSCLQTMFNTRQSGDTGADNAAFLRHLWKDHDGDDDNGDGVFYVPFNIISFIPRQWKGDNERLCAFKRRSCVIGVLPPEGFQPGNSWSNVGNANTRASGHFNCRKMIYSET